MKHLKIALSDSVQSRISSIEGRICVPVYDTDFIDVGAVVIGDCDLDLVNNNQIHTFGIPIIHSSIVQAIKLVSSSINILQVVPFIISLGKIYLEQTFVMQM